MCKFMVANLVVVFAASSALADEPTCHAREDWDGAVTVDGRFRASGERDFDVLAAVCFKRDLNHPTRAWGVMRYLGDVDMNPVHHRYSHPTCISIFPSPPKVVLVGKQVGRDSQATNWTRFDIDITSKNVRVRNLTEAEAEVHCKDGTPPDHFPGQYISGQVSLDSF